MGRFNRGYDDYPEDEANKLGLLLDDPSLHHSLSLVDPSDDEKPHVDEGLHRITHKGCRKWIEDYYGLKEFDWEQRWRDLPFKMIAHHFTVEEMTKMKWNSFIMSEVSEEFRYNPEYRVIGKVCNALHHWCYGKNNYNQLVYWYNALPRFDFGEGFEVRLDYSTYFNERGYSKYTRTYVDGPLAYMIYHKGKHVLTVSFGPSAYGLLLTQIQMKEKKGNRWLYKLPCHYIEYVVQRFAEAFHDTPLWIADGMSLANRVQSSYPEKDRHKWNHHEHVARVYDHDFEGFTRTGETTSVKGTTFNRLQPVDGSLEWFCPSMNYRPYPERDAA